MNCNFGKNPGAEQATATAETSPTPDTTTAVAAPHRFAPPAKATNAMPGDYVPQFIDIQFPRVNIVQKVGDLSNIYPHGAVLFAQKQLIFELPVKDQKQVIVKPGTAPVEMVVVGLKPKRFMEQIAYGSEERALVVNSEDEVTKAGGTCSYEEWQLKEDEGMRLFLPTVDSFLGIRKPDHIEDPNHTLFPYKVGEQWWALSMWMFKKTSYTHGAKKIFTARATGCLMNGLNTHTWALSTALKQRGKNFYFIPVLEEGVPSSPELLAFCAKALCAE
jgi:hypothetical protein